MTPLELTPTARAYSGIVQAAVAVRASTADIWAAIRDAQATAERTYPQVSLQEVNSLRSWAASNRNAMERLATAGTGATLTGDMVGIDLSARTAVARAAAPEYWVRLQLSGVDETGNETTKWLTITTLRELPVTVTDLYTQLDQTVLAAGAGYGISTVVYGTVSIVAV